MNNASHFYLAQLLNAHLATIEELTISEVNKDDFKKLLGGESMHIAVKYETQPERDAGTSTQTTVGSTVTNKTVQDTHPELEYYVDTNRNFQSLEYPEATDDDYLKAESPTLPIVTIPKDDQKDYNGNDTVWRPTTPFYLFNNRGILHKEDSKP